MVHIIDLNFQRPHTIAAFVVTTSVGPVVVETGPHSTFEALKQGIASIGYQLSEVKHVLLTHIHFDHAGAAWALAEEGAHVYVHPRGYKHMANPERLYNSAKRIYGDMMEPLWGKMEAIPTAQLTAVEDRVEIQIGDTSFVAHHTPGHANHHIAWQMGSQVFCGDVGGIAIGDNPFITAPCPPPEIDMEAWERSIQRVLSLSPTDIYIAHFGHHTHIERHFEGLRFILQDWANWIRPHWEAGKSPEEVVPDFQAYCDKQLADHGASPSQIKEYNIANPPGMSVAGIMRYWQKKYEKEGK